jgi:hypothetical protein
MTPERPERVLASWRVWLMFADGLGIRRAPYISTRPDRKVHKNRLDAHLAFLAFSRSAVRHAIDSESSHLKLAVVDRRETS